MIPCIAAKARRMSCPCLALNALQSHSAEESCIELSAAQTCSFQSAVIL